MAGLTRSVDVGDAQGSIVERSGGNPLYAEELVRLLREHIEDASPSDRALDEAMRRELPASLHTLISARLDSLGPLLRRPPP